MQVGVIRACVATYQRVPLTLRCATLRFAGGERVSAMALL